MIIQCPKTGRACEVTGCNGCWEAEPVKQEPVAMYCSYPNCTCINPTLCRAQNAAPVDAKAIRAEDYIKAYQQGRKDMKEEAAKVCEKAMIQMNYSEAPYKQCAAAIRGLK